VAVVTVAHVPQRDGARLGGPAGVPEAVVVGVEVEASHHALVDEAVAVVVHAVAELRLGALVADAVGPHPVEAGLLTAAAAASGLQPTVGRAAAADPRLAVSIAAAALIGGAVAVVVDPIAGLGRAGVDRRRHVVAVAAEEREAAAGRQRARAHPLLGDAEAVAVAVGVDHVRDALVDEAVAVLVAAVADLGGV